MSHVARNGSGIFSYWGISRYGTSVLDKCVPEIAAIYLLGWFTIEYHSHTDNLGLPPKGLAGFWAAYKTRHGLE